MGNAVKWDFGRKGDSENGFMQNLEYQSAVMLVPSPLSDYYLF